MPLIEEFWRVYATSLSILSSFLAGRKEFPEISYLLPEDEETVGFVPLSQDARNGKRWWCVPKKIQKEDRLLDGSDNDKAKEIFEKKPRIGDRGVKRQHETMEMLARIRDLVRDGEEVVEKEEKIPVSIGKTTEEHDHCGGGRVSVFLFQGGAPAELG